jgi:transcriptional regulator with XRE-family HTH domain
MPRKEPNSVDTYVGARVRMRRITLGMSQEKLGDALGVTFQQVQKYEKGSNRISASRLENISRVLDVQPSFFFEGLARGQQSAPGFAEDAQSRSPMDFLSTAEGLHLNKAFARIADAKLRRCIVELVVALADKSAGRSDTT